MALDGEDSCSKAVYQKVAICPLVAFLLIPSHVFAYPNIPLLAL